MLATGYLFTAAMAVAHALSFPGLFSDTGLLGATPQTTAWLYMFWHAGFPLLVCAYALLRRSPQPPRISLSNGVVLLGSIAAVLAAVVVVVLMATAEEGVLPPVMIGNHYTPALVPVVTAVWLSPLTALVLLAFN